MKSASLTILTTAAALLASALALAQPAVQSTRAPAASQGIADSAARCNALIHGGPDLARRFAYLLDAPTTILSAKLVPAGGNGDITEKDLPEHCRVEGQIAPTVGFLLRMPTQTFQASSRLGASGLAASR